MRKLFLVSLLSLFLFTKTNAQNINIDTLKQLVYDGQDDTLKVQRLILLGNINTYSKPDSGLVYAENALHLSKKINYKSGEANSLFLIGQNLSQLGDYAGSLSFAFKALTLSQELDDLGGIILTTEAIGTHYRDHGDYKQALIYLLKAKSLAETLPNDASVGGIETKEQCLMYQNAEIGFSYLSTYPDSAIFFANKSYQTDLKVSNGEWTYPLIVLGNAYSAMNQYDSALHYYKLGLKDVSNISQNDLADNYIGIANVFKKRQLYDSCIYYAKQGLDVCKNISYQKGIYDVSGLLAAVYENINPVESIKYYKLNKATNDILFGKDKEQQVQSYAFNEQLQQQELQQKLEQTNLIYKNRLNIYILLAGLLLLIVVAGGLWLKNIYKQKSYALLQKQKQEIDLQKANAEQSLHDLKITQSQLIQSEKMASLGELTAGIAHEIQNPLNFVNNFSEVNSELISELVDEVKKGNYDEVELIAVSLKDNEQKINHHGKRADAIVKGMLQHTRISTGQKEPANINALADEYLRLSYHGLRAKEKDFNAEIKTDFDPDLSSDQGNINIIPQDIGRVLLNLYNNAFDAVSERQKNPGDFENPRGFEEDLTDFKNLSGLQSYQPTVSVSTKRNNSRSGPPVPERTGDGGIEISVRDNGNGIPPNILDKIFQPFFTTKPTGKGTGLGLSLSYDIVKSHGGEIRVESNKDEGSTFIIELPAT